MGERAYHTKEEILARGREAIGIPLREIDKTDRLNTGKGAVGSVLEESWFGYHINSEAEADFAEAGVELKATPYMRTSKGIRAKERLVCNIINYMEEYKHSFYDSSFWKKCNTMLLMSYEHKEGIPKGDFTIDEAVLFSFPTEDLYIIEKDWETIVGKIRAGRAHELSEGDTLYLGACTKGATAATMRQQPFSDIPAKQRAFSLKQSYMTYVLNSYIFLFMSSIRAKSYTAANGTTSSVDALSPFMMSKMTDSKSSAQARPICCLSLGTPFSSKGTNRSISSSVILFTFPFAYISSPSAAAHRLRPCLSAATPPQFPLSSPQSASSASPRTPRGCGRRHCGRAFCRLAIWGSSVPRRDGR